jgi:acyl-coenzyme A synthetase/AMP-(fatty) acid ligase
MNWTTQLWSNCKSFPDRDAVLIDGVSIRYKDLFSQTSRLIFQFQKIGLCKGDVVAISMQNPLRIFICSLALATMGCVVSSALVGGNDRLRSAFLKSHQVKYVVSPKKIDEIESVENLNIFFLDANQLFKDAQTNSLFLPITVTPCDEADPWLIANTSGTTGVPKSVRITHGAEIQAATLPRYPDLDIKSALIFFSSMMSVVSFQPLIYMLHRGGTVILPKTQTLDVLWDLLKNYAPELVVTSGQKAIDIARFVVKHPGLSDVFASRPVKVLEIRGSSVPSPIMKTLVSKVCESLRVNYGSTEAGGIASLSVSSEPVSQRYLGSLYPWVVAQVVSEDGAVLSHGEVGFLRFKTPTMCLPEYIADTESSTNVFKNGWFYPRDLGSIDDKGQLYLSGRIDNRLNLGGVKINPEEVESILNMHPLVSESALFLSYFNNKPLLVGALVCSDTVSVSDVLEFCEKKLSKRQIPQRIIFVHELPKSFSGKIDRKALNRLFIEDSTS